MSNIEAPLLVYSPVVRDGIPDFFTAEEQSEWIKIQRHRCLHGYQPDGYEPISGKHYFYLNFYKIMRVPIAWDRYKGTAAKIKSFPFYRDIDHILFNKIEIAQSSGRNLILGKRRRAGVTEVLVACVIHEILYYKFNKAVYAVPEEKYLSNSFYKKFNVGFFSIHETMFQRMLLDNPEEKFIAYRKPSKEGDKLAGMQSTLYLKFFSKAGVVKGADARLCVMDEVGEFSQQPFLKPCFLETKESLEEGGMVIGSIILAGTSDRINNKNKDYQDLWDNASEYNMDTHFIPATYWYYDEENKQPFYDITTGKSDLESAERYIIDKADRLYALEDKTAYYKFKQNHPLEPNDMWVFAESNEMSPLNMATINKRIMDVTLEPRLRAQIKVGDLIETVDKEGIPTGKYEWNDNPKGRYRKFLEPINGKDFKGADIGGIDDYLKDKAPESRSKGAIVIWRRFIDASMICCVPVCVYHNRPATRVEFFDDCIKIAVYYNCEVAFEYIDDELYKHFKARNRLHLLKQYPMVGGKYVEQKNAAKYSVKDLAKNVIRGRIASWVDSSAFQNECDLEVLRECANFDKENTDIMSALGICFLFDNDIERLPVEKIEKDKDKRRVAEPEFGWQMKDGRLQATRPVLKMNTFGWESQVQRNHDR